MGPTIRHFRATTLLLVIATAVLGCASPPMEANIHASLIPTDLTSDHDSLLLMPPTAAEGLVLADGHLVRFQSILFEQLHEMIRSNVIPPVFEEGTDFRGDPAEIHVNISDLDITQHRRLWGLGGSVTNISMNVEIRFIDHEYGDPLGDWVDLSTIHGPAEGKSMNQALAEASQQICLHIARDRQGI